MKETIYYYKTATGTFHFSNGQVRPEHRAGQYIRMLRYAKYPLEPLYLDNKADFERIRELFCIHEGKTWQEVYYEY